MREGTVNTIFFFILTTFSVSFSAQKGLVNMNREYDFELESKIYQTDSNFHTLVKPYTLNSLTKINVKLPEGKSDFFLQKIIDKTYSKENGLLILPIASASGTMQFETREIFPEYSAGAILKGFVGEKFSFNAIYRYVGSNLPGYVDSSIYTQQVIPSIAKSTSIGTGMLNAHHWEGYLSYNPNRFFSFLLGKGKHFWGDGYRSLLLSDNASSYPYFRIESKFWNVKYVNLYSWHNDFRLGENRNKFSTSHILSWNVIKNFNLGLFETVVWQGSDTLHNRGFEVTYLNPAIFYRSPEYSIGSADNSLIGATFKVRIKQKNILYGQVMLDEFYLKEIRDTTKWWANKYGYQFGFKLFDFLGVENLALQSEFNAVRPFAYSHITSLQNYAHNNQSLAHPVGSSFYESSNFIRFKKNKWYFEEQFNFLLYGKDTSSVSYGGDMFQSYMSRDGDYGHTIGQGEKHKVYFNSIKISYSLLQETNLRVFAQFVLRLDKYSQYNYTSSLFQIGISSLIWNEYKDY